MFEKLRALFKIVGLIRQATGETKMGTEVKPGYKTTEFWLSLLANLPPMACMLTGKDSLPCMLAGALTAIVYIVQRGLLKQKALELAKALNEMPQEAPPAA